MVAIVCLSLLSVFLGVACWINGSHADKLERYIEQMNEENYDLTWKNLELTKELDKMKKEMYDAADAYDKEREEIIQEHIKQLNEMKAMMNKMALDEKEMRLIAKYFMKYTKTDDELLF